MRALVCPWYACCLCASVLTCLHMLVVRRCTSLNASVRFDRCCRTRCVVCLHARASSMLLLYASVSPLL